MREKRVMLDYGTAGPKLKEMLSAGASVPIVVTGSSMVPFLRHQKDVVYLRSPDLMPPKRGDILFFQRDTGEFILHRLYRIVNGNFIINGDAQNWFEGITPNQVLGVVEKISRNKGKKFSPRRLDWKVMSTIWRWLLPVRPRLLNLFGKISRIKSR